MAPSVAWTIGQRRGLDWDIPVVRHDAERSADLLAASSEADLVAACLDGTPGALDRIVERHQRTIYQLCYRFVGNHEDASDLSQDVFLRAYRGLRTFRGRSTLATWLYRIAVNLCLNKIGARAPRSEPIDERRQVDTRHESAAERLIAEERRSLVRAAVARLPPKQRAALILRVYHEMSHQEIARLLGSSVGAVKVNVFHGLQNLKKLLGQEPI